MREKFFGWTLEWLATNLNHIKLKNLPLQVDLRLLAFRIGIGGMLFINHGMEKIFHYDEMLKWFPDPFDIGRLPGFIVAFSARTKMRKPLDDCSKGFLILTNL